MPNHNHWVPGRKYQLVEALGRKWPGDRTKLQKMSKRQLYAIWFQQWPDCPGCSK